MTSGYLELDPHNYIADLDWPRCDITYCSSIVIHSEPKYKFDLSLVIYNQLMHVLLVCLWQINSHHNMEIHNIIVSMLQGTLITPCDCGTNMRTQHTKPCLTLTDTLLLRWCVIDLIALSALEFLWYFHYWYQKIQTHPNYLLSIRDKIPCNVVMET